MEHKRILQIAFIFFACGLSIELLKTLGKSSPLNLKRATIATKLDDYDVQYGTVEVPVDMPVIKLANGFSGGQKINGVKLADKKKAEVKKDTKKEEKKDAKKKKKKKKKKVDSFEPDEDALAKLNKDKKDKLKDPTGPAGTYFANNTIVANQPDQNKNHQKTLQEWENLLLKDASIEETKKFIALYRSRDVSPEIFYTIAKKMLEDQRPQMRQLGLTLLDSSPSTASYELLSEAYYHESNNSALRSKMDQSLAYYTRPESFNFLMQGLSRQKSLAINFTSVTVLSRAIDRFKTEQARVAATTPTTTTTVTPGATPTATPPTATPPSTSTPPATVRPSRVQSLFSKFTLPLSILVAEKDPNLAPSAAQVLTQLQALLN